MNRGEFIKLLGLIPFVGAAFAGPGFSHWDIEPELPEGWSAPTDTDSHTGTWTVRTSDVYKFGEQPIVAEYRVDVDLLKSMSEDPVNDVLRAFGHPHSKVEIYDGSRRIA